MFPLIAALVLIAARLSAQQPERYAIEPLVSQLAEGYIDWTQHALFAYGDGTAPAAVSNPVQQRLHGLRNARDAAFRNMRQLIGQVRLNADTQLQDAGLDRDFQDLVRVAIGSQSEDQGRYRIAVRMLLLGDFATAVLPEVEPIDPRSHDLSHFDDSPAVPTTADSLMPAIADSLAVPAIADSLTALATDSLAVTATPDSLTTPATFDSLAVSATTDSLTLSATADSLAVNTPDSLTTPPNADSLAAEELVFFVPEAPYTGLLVDVRGLGLQPSIAPRVLSAAGHVIHGAATVDRSLATSYGVVGYDDDIDRAYTSERLGGEEANPFVVRATGTAGRYSGDAVLDDFDAVQVLQADEVGDFLRQGRVTFLLGPAPAAFDDAYFDSTYTDTFILEGIKNEFEFYGEMEPSDLQE
ncbi:MAG: hypothetical protein J4F35_05385 [Candidatus Latescibacteria bacterium]|nr:hypothetical protein [Candidatus Latescibacterota bacterium]